MEQHILYKDTQCFYKTRGSGPAMLLIHGLCEDGDMWDDFAEPFTHEFTIITPDLPGFYRSELPKEELSVELMAEAIKAMLDAEGITRAIVIGHSMGGYVALALAERYPDLVTKLVLFHSHPFADSGEKRQNRQKTITFIQKHGTPLFLHEFYPNLFAPAFAEQHPQLIQQLVDRGMQYDVAGIIAAFEALIKRPDRSAVLRGLQVPVLFIIGKQDNAVPYRQSLQQAHLPQVAEVQVLTEVGHMGMYEAKEQCRQIVRNFMRLHI